jgi:hypothetical protein
MKKFKDGAAWGDWHLEASNLTLVLKSGNASYEVDLEQITDSAQMLDWIFQLRTKPWVTNDTISDLVSAFQDLFSPQETICGGGVNQTINPTAWLRSVIAKD